MEKHPDDLLTGDSDPFKGDPNFMASLARGLEVIQAFTPQRRVLSISQISQKTGIPRAAVRRITRIDSSRLALFIRFDLTATGNRLPGARRATLQKPLGVFRCHPCRVGCRIEFFLVGQ